MIFRGIAARRLLSFTTFLLSAIVVAGTVASIGFGRLTHVSRGSAGALVLLGLVALAAQSVESVRRREHDLALARLRGQHGLRLFVFTVAEPTLVVVAGALAGLLGGWSVGSMAVSRWLPRGASFTLDSTELVGAAIVTAACIVVVWAAGWRIMRSPLQEQLAGVRRPRAAATYGLFLQVVLVLGAVVAFYQARQDARSRVDWVSLISPAVIGLAAAQVLIWLLLALFAVLVPRSAGAPLSWFVTLRRLLRRADSLALLRVVVAAGVVFCVAVSASAAADGWRVERAKLQVGAPMAYPVPGGALRAFAAAHTADPSGRWLLPVAAYTTDTDPGSRRVFVDASRWDNVVGDFFANTSSASLAHQLAAFPAPPARVYSTGDTVGVSMTADSVPRQSGVGLVFQYVDDQGDLSTASIPLRRTGGSAAGGSQIVRFSRPLPGCRAGCALVELDLRGYPRDTLEMTDVRFAGSPALDPSSGFRPASDLESLRVHPTGTGLVVGIERTRYGLSSTRTLGTFRRPGALPVIATAGTPYVVSHGVPTIPGVDGSSRPARIEGRTPVLPFVGTRGMLSDLGTVLLGAGGSIPTTDAYVLARDDTPTAVVAALRSSGSVASPHTYDGTLQRLASTPRAQGTRLYLVIAFFSALIALVSLASAVVQQRPERRREAAGLRVVGVPTRLINGAYHRETALLAAAAFLGTCVASYLACRALLPALPLVSGWLFAPPLDASPRVVTILATALACAAGVAALTYLAFRRIGRSAAPRMLREDLP